MTKQAENNESDTFPKRLRIAIGISGKSQAHIAREVGIKSPHFSQILSGKIGCKDYELKKRIAYATFVSEKWLISGIGEPIPPLKTNENVLGYGESCEKTGGLTLDEAEKLKAERDEYLSTFSLLLPNLDKAGLYALSRKTDSAAVLKLIIDELTSRDKK